MKVVTAAQMRAAERRAEEAGRPPALLMENAGLAVAREVQRALGAVANRQIVVLVGPGNNGGDGLVAARHLWDWGARVHLYVWNRPGEVDSNFARTRERGIPHLFLADDAGGEQLRLLVGGADAIIDSLLGTGKARPIEGSLKSLLLTLREALAAAAARGSRPRLVALDLPTGLDPDTGAVDPAAVPADLTVTLGYPKLGLYRFPGAEYLGDLVVADIGLSPDMAADVKSAVVTGEWARRLLPARPRAAHKGTFGRALAIVGSVNYVGAAYLAAAAATRVGAGLVTLAIAESLQPILAAKLTETTFLPLPEVEPGVIGAEAGPLVRRVLANYDALLIGPGLGTRPPTLAFLRSLLTGSPTPSYPADSRIGAPADALRWPLGQATAVVDADGLNLLVQIPRWWEMLGPNVVVTPHPGEMGRLLGTSAREVETDRLAIAQGAAARWQKTVLLKGAFTVVAEPDGSAAINPFALAGLASAGTGDVLSGTVLGFLAQGVPAPQAAVVAAYVHALAGEMVAAELGDAGMVASDLLPLLPRAIRRLRTT